MTLNRNTLCIVHRALCIAFAAVAANAAGATYWVATAADNGDDSHAGTEQAPFATLDAALAVADDGDTIRVRAGTYPIPAQTVARNASYGAASRPAWWVTNAVAIVGDGPEATFFDGENTANRYAFLINNDGASISGVTVKRVTSSVAYQLQESAEIHLERGVASNCVVRDCSNYYVGALSSRFGLIVDCVASNVTCSDSLSMGAGFVVIGLGSNGTGVISNCQAYACMAKRGAGIHLESPYGRAYNCLVTNCKTENSSRGNAGPLYVAGSGALASHCVVTNNQGVSGGGATVIGGTLRNCLVAFNRNTSKTGGGGVSISRGTIDSCTIAQNVNEYIEGAHGLYQTGGTVVNSIVAFNDENYQIYNLENHLFNGGTCTYTCTFPDAAGAGNSVADPCFVNRLSGDFHLSDYSTLFDAASQQGWMANARDLDGNPRISGTAPNPGVYEGETPENPPFNLSLQASSIYIAANVPVTFTATPYFAPDPDISYRWEIGGETVSTEQTFSYAFATCGIFPVRCIGTSGGVTVTNDLANAIQCNPPVVYVSNTGTGTWPCDTPATATNDLNAAAKIVMAPPGGRGIVYVLDDTYYPSSLISIIGGSVHVIGTNAVFWATQMTDRGQNGILYLNAPDCIVSGLTFGGCNATGNGYGACLTIIDGVVSNCVVTDNIGNGWAGGAVTMRKGLFTHGVIRNNTNYDGGAGGGGRVAFSLISVNNMPGTVSGTIAHTVITNNSATCVGAGQISAAGMVTNCIIRGNKSTQISVSSKAGAIYVTGEGKVIDTLIEGCEYKNTSNVGGTVFLENNSAILRNCLVTGSTNALNPIVRLTKGKVENCTVAGNVVNSSEAVAVGVLAASGTTLQNTIVWDNVANGVASNLSDSGATITTCLFADPHFRDAPESRYMLKSKSPARNVGTFQSWMNGAKDLAGMPRINQGAVDIGCYECFLPFGTVLSLR